MNMVCELPKDTVKCCGKSVRACVVDTALCRVSAALTCASRRPRGCALGNAGPNIPGSFLLYEVRELDIHPNSRPEWRCWKATL